MESRLINHEVNDLFSALSFFNTQTLSGTQAPSFMLEVGRFYVHLYHSLNSLNVLNYYVSRHMVKNN